MKQNEINKFRDSILRDLNEDIRENERGKITRFMNEFGGWKRPTFLPKYDLKKLVQSIHYSLNDKSVIEATNFVNSFREDEQHIVGEVLRFYGDLIERKPCTDKLLNDLKTSVVDSLTWLGF